MAGKQLGVLVLHGFTSSVKAVDGIVPYLKQEGIPYALPILRGHGKRPQALRGVTYRDWIEDAEIAFHHLLTRCNQVAIVGLSMGGLVALELGMRHPKKIAGVVLVAPALKFVNPFAPLAPYLGKLLPYFPGQPSFKDRHCAKDNRNYRYFPVTTFASLYEFSRRIEKKLPEFDRPLVILQHRAKQVTHPDGAKLIYKRVSSAHKDLIWFNRSGHEMMQDLEKEKVFTAILSTLHQWRNAHA